MAPALTSLAQPGILHPLPPVARMVSLQRRHVDDATFAAALDRLATVDIDDHVVIGFGASVIAAAGGAVDGCREAPALAGVGVSVPSTPQAMWWWLRGVDRGELLATQRTLEDAVGAAFVIDDVADTFVHAGGRDLSGYEDGTENPDGDDAVAAALAAVDVDGVRGGSFVAVQRWRHDLRSFLAHGQSTRDQMIGRRQHDNVELEDAPASAHVKRTAQEDFSPEAFVWRRSMPWADASGEGLMFVAFGHSFDAFEAQLRRMVGLDDGVVDALFSFTRPASTAYFFCPPVTDGHLDLRALRRS